MANLVLAFAEILAGAVLVDAGIKGDSIANVVKGKATQHPIDLGGAAGGGGNVAGTAGLGTAVAGGTPFAKATNLHVGRTDQGVDFTGSGPIPAVIDGIVTRVVGRGGGSGWPGGGFVVVKGTGQYAGKWTYLAENFDPTVKQGQQVSVGTILGNAIGSYPYIEYGWAADDNGTTLAHATTGYVEGQVTSAGSSFRAFLKALGAPV